MRKYRLDCLAIYLIKHLFMGEKVQSLVLETIFESTECNLALMIQKSKRARQIRHMSSD